MKSLILVALTTLLMLTIAYLKYEPFEFTVLDGPVYLAEDPIRFERKVTLERAVSVKILRSVVNKETGHISLLESFVYEPNESYLTANLTFYFDIPSSLAKGTYVYMPVAQLQVNTFKTITRPLPTFEFVVTK